MSYAYALWGAVVLGDRFCRDAAERCFGAEPEPEPEPPPLGSFICWGVAGCSLDRVRPHQRAPEP